MTLAAGTSAMHLSDAGPSISLSPWDLSLEMCIGARLAGRHGALLGGGDCGRCGRASTITAGTAPTGRDFVEEVAACLLGGYGMPFEVGLAASMRCATPDCVAGTPSRGGGSGRAVGPSSCRRPAGAIPVSASTREIPRRRSVENQRGGRLADRGACIARLAAGAARHRPEDCRVDREKSPVQ